MSSMTLRVALGNVLFGALGDWAFRRNPRGRMFVAIGGMIMLTTLFTCSRPTDHIGESPYMKFLYILYNRIRPEACGCLSTPERAGARNTSTGRPRFIIDSSLYCITGAAATRWR
jgi:hypothetical protein